MSTTDTKNRVVRVLNFLFSVPDNVLGDTHSGKHTETHRHKDEEQKK